MSFKRTEKTTLTSIQRSQACNILLVSGKILLFSICNVLFLCWIMPYLCTHLLSCYCQIYKCDTFRKCSRNATCPRYDTCKTRSFGLMTRVWDFTVTTTSRARDSTVAMATQEWNKFHSITMIMTSRIWNGAIWMADWIWDKLIRLAEWIWDGVEWLAEWIWDELTWLAEWTWNGITWLAGCIWDGVTWAGNPFTVKLNYVTDVAAKFSGECLDSKWRNGLYVD